MAARDLTVTRLSVTPVKGLRMQHPDQVTLDDSGAVGDRDFMLVDVDGRLVSATTFGPLVTITSRWDPGSGRLTLSSVNGAVADGFVELGDPIMTDMYGFDERPGHLVQGPWTEFIASTVGKDLRLVKLDAAGAGSDVKPVTLVGEGSIRTLEREARNGPIDARRFRMLIQFSSQEGHIEDRWEGREIEVGGALLRLGGAVPRCAAVTRDPDSGRRDRPVVKEIKAYRGLGPTGFGEGVPFGVYADVVNGGVVRVGDVLRVGEAP